jgi:Ca2+-transporting ATPase
VTVEESRGTAFIALVVANLTLALVDAVGAEGRILDPERRIYWTIAGALMAVLAMVVASPWLAGIFHLAAPSAQYVLLAIGVGLISGAWHWPLRRLGAVGRRA